MGAFIEEDGDEDDNLGCPDVETPGFLTWIDYVEPAKTALLQYANNGEPIPEMDLMLNSMQGIFKMYTVFNKDDYKGDDFCRGFMFSKECSKMIFKFGFTQMDKGALAEAAAAKKKARK